MAILEGCGHEHAPRIVATPLCGEKLGGSARPGTTVTASRPPDFPLPQLGAAFGTDLHHWIYGRDASRAPIFFACGPRFLLLEPGGGEKVRLSRRRFGGKENIDQEVVAADLRGHGRSGKPTSQDTYQSKIFVDDFKTVMDAFGLLAAWSMGGRCGSVSTIRDTLGQLSGVIYPAGVPSTGEMIPPKYGRRRPLWHPLTDDVSALRASSAIFAEKLFAQPDTVPYAAKCLYMGHSLPPEIIKSILDRPMDLQPPGTADVQRAGSRKNVEDVTQPHFKSFECVWLEGRGHALHYECPENIVRLLVKFTQREGGKASTMLTTARSETGRITIEFAADKGVGIV
ncbi:hypothetical protein DFH09DRAFT_1281455 [Mycena vulgaris]|nr:hypothetical protein DFH09DRAFT_1281455 [Mycena vulgaris]